VDQHPLLAEVERLAARTADRDGFLLETARAINRHFPHYNWIGFYFLKDGKLHVGPYIGKPTPHTIIDLNKGICGAAVSQAKTIVVDDVNADPNYLACSLETKSEIVVPIHVEGKIVGELDIDSDKKAAFGDNDRVLMEKTAKIIGDMLGRL
jgi:GAF domain-containing protein